MKNVFKATVLMALMCGVALAQNASPSSNSGTPQPQAQTSAPQTSQSAMAAQHPTRIAPGSVIPVQLTKTVDAKKAKTGDEVVAKVTQDMKTQTGEVLVPKDTKVTGHVTEAQARTKDEKQSELAIDFDHANLKGQDVQLPMSIQAVIGPQNNASSAPGGNDAGAAASTGGGSPSPSASAGRGGMGGSQQPQAPSAAPPRESMPSSPGKQSG